jgi:hypothetical protein
LRHWNVAEVPFYEHLYRDSSGLATSRYCELPVHKGFRKLNSCKAPPELTQVNSLVYRKPPLLMPMTGDVGPFSDNPDLAI